ncbi:hypothetical protein DFJ43DRAFT_1073055 [Lentinula guzmanii]|uniref:Nucleotidylyl transferase n=1 Tax=Lentinula guzmanii TaxID=2804957 RepID=A0AA38MU33_9AGAR|nr:hypothetical protein DFJ43DRAFT_1073055 [Lentinula guzmanii]
MSAGLHSFRLLSLKGLAFRMSSTPSSSFISSSLQHLGSVDPPVEIIWTSHPLWPVPSSRALSQRKLNISVLDSSFNPPTVAHCALANTRRPRHADSSDEYDGKLLLLSVRNADKQLKPGDATYTQRIEMMIQLAEDLRDADSHGNGSNDNIAVAIIDEPTFVGKSRLLQIFLKERLRSISSSLTPEVDLTFILGFDTLERLFALKYYDASEDKMFKALRGFFSQSDGDGSCVACARRNTSSYPHTSIPSPNSASETNSLSQTISNFLASSALPSSCISIIDIGEDVWSVSSSDVREGVGKESGATEKSSGEGGFSKGGRRQWREMVPEHVRRYIIEHDLYK